MKPSSRTPEGLPNRCPVCGVEMRLEPSPDTYDAPCPACGSLLWFDPNASEFQQVFSTGEAARACKVSQQTIVRCFDSGELKGFYRPGTRFRRIPRESLKEFMIAHGISVETL